MLRVPDRHDSEGLPDWQRSGQSVWPYLNAVTILENSNRWRGLEIQTTSNAFATTLMRKHARRIIQIMNFTSDARKAVSSQNSFKQGLYSSRLVIPSDDPAQLDALKATLFAEHKPANETEALLVQEMAEHYWLMKRYRRLETTFLSLDRPQPREAEAAQRMHGRAERSFYKAFKTLRELKKERKLQERAASQNAPAVSRGFVPSENAAAANGFVPSRDVAATNGFVPSQAVAEANGFVPSNLRPPGSVA